MYVTVLKYAFYMFFGIYTGYLLVLLSEKSFSSTSIKVATLLVLISGYSLVTLYFLLS